MGQQQLLLIILGVIVVGIAVAVGITMFQDNAVSANRDAVTNDLVNLASRAQQYYRRPTALSGGGNSFVGLTANTAGLQKLTSKSTNANGSYAITTAGDATHVVVTGTGKEKGDNGTGALVMFIDVAADSTVVTKTN
jgi:Tfp pilus assembly protein PilE